MEIEVEETVTASSSGGYDVPFLGDDKNGRKDPLKIDGIKSVKKSRAIVDKKFPKYGGEGGYYVEPDDKCSKFPYCKQGVGNFKIIKECLEEISREKNIPYSTLLEILNT